MCMTSIHVYLNIYAHIYSTLYVHVDMYVYDMHRERLEGYTQNVKSNSKVTIR